METSYLSPIERFSPLVENYAKYRPGYPEQILFTLEKHFGINNEKIIADIGSGTGQLSKLFVNKYYQTYGIEPNAAMRMVSINEFATYLNFKAIKGTAEQTFLYSESIDLIVAGQSFHWFDNEMSKIEFNRILKHKGIIALIWNERKNETEFMQRYERLLQKHCSNYKINNHKEYDYRKIKELFSEKKVDLFIFENQQKMDFTAFIGRLKSCSYCPSENDKHYAFLMRGMNKLYENYKCEENITIEYNTLMFVIH